METSLRPICWMGYLCLDFYNCVFMFSVLSILSLSCNNILLSLCKGPVSGRYCYDVHYLNFFYKSLEKKKCWNSQRQKKMTDRFHVSTHLYLKPTERIFSLLAQHIRHLSLCAGLRLQDRSLVSSCLSCLDSWTDSEPNAIAFGWCLHFSLQEWKETLLPILHINSSNKWCHLASTGHWLFPILSLRFIGLTLSLCPRPLTTEGKHIDCIPDDLWSTLKRKNSAG